MFETLKNIFLPETLTMAHLGIQVGWTALTIYFSLLIDGREEKFPCMARAMKVSRIAIILVTFFYISYYNLWC